MYLSGSTKNLYEDFFYTYLRSGEENEKAKKLNGPVEQWFKD